MITSFSRNTTGRDFIVGDIHGCFDRLQVALDDIGFDPRCDRLFSVGDMVDRGPNSYDVLDWLEKPWFHPVRGNHEQMAIDAAKGMFDSRTYAQNGGQWFMDMPRMAQEQFAIHFNALPIAIEIDTAAGLVGIVHANCPHDSWDELKADLQNRPDTVGMTCMWDRTRVNNGDNSGVQGLVALVVGHTPVQRPLTLGNVFHIDTGAVFPGHNFTILDVATLLPVPLPVPQLDHAA